MPTRGKGVGNYFLTDPNFSSTTRATVTATQGGTWTLAGTSTPSAPASLALASDTGNFQTDKVTSVATITGTAAAGSTVTLTVGGKTLTATADTSGAFSITPTSGLAQGSNTAKLTQRT